jgi:hypothetical protein
MRSEIRMQADEVRLHASKIARGVNVSIPMAQKSDSQAGEHRGVFGDERRQVRMRSFELFNGLF